HTEGSMIPVQDTGSGSLMVISCNRVHRLKCPETMPPSCAIATFMITTKLLIFVNASDVHLERFVHS
ncbi:MAG: hypothetical protein WAK10_03450, partial [Methanoregula sp.]